MIVLDCSAALAIAQNTEAGRAFRKLIEPQELLAAPSLFTAEAANAAWKYVHAGIHSAEHAREMMRNALALVDRFTPMEDLVEEAFAAAAQLDCSVYDMAYLVLARRNAATLMTCDKKLQQACISAMVPCVESVAF